MEEQHFGQLQSDLITQLEKRLFAAGPDKKSKELIREAVADEFASAVSQEKMSLLTSEEVSLLKAFRRFKLRCKAGSVFKWSTFPEDAAGTGVILAEDSGIAVDPREIA